MDQTIIPLIKEDHVKIKELLSELSKICQNTEVVDTLSCKQKFQGLRELVNAHAEAEEGALYNIFENEQVEDYRELKHFSIEGYEEHSLVDLLIREMTDLPEMSLEWNAKFRVLSDLLLHHIHHEERKFLPAIKSKVSKDILRDLGILFMEERAEILARQRRQFDRAKMPA